MKRERDTYRVREYAVILLFVLITAVCLVESWRILQMQMEVNSPGMLPMMLSLVMSACIAGAFIGVRRRIPKEAERYASKRKLAVDAVREEFPVNVVGTIAITVLYLFSLKFFLYVPATIVYLLLNMLFLGRKKINKGRLLTIGLVAVVVTAFVYVVFGILFKVTLP